MTQGQKIHSGEGRRKSIGCSLSLSPVKRQYTFIGHIFTFIMEDVV